MTTGIEIHTPRLRLLGIGAAEIHRLFDTKNKEELSLFFGFDENGYQHYKKMHEGGMETFRLSLFVFLLIDKLTEKTIGECGFHTWNKHHRRAELFYSLHDPASKRQGFMTEALLPVLAHGFSTMDLHRVQALVAADNTASIKLLQANSFTKEGTMRQDYCVNGENEDSDCYSLLKPEWQNQQHKTKGLNSAGH